MKALLGKLGLAGVMAWAPCRADVQVMTCVMELPQQRLSELLSGDTSGDALFATLRAEVEAGRAKTMDTSLVRSKSERKATIESIAERIGMTEGLGGQCDRLQKNPSPRSRRPDLRPWPDFIMFEIRNVGFSGEVNVTLLDGGQVDLYSVSQQVTVTSPFVYADWKDELGQRHVFSQPHYASLRAEIDPVLKTGSWTLISVQSATGADGSIDRSRKLVAFVRVDDLDAPSAQ